MESSYALVWRCWTFSFTVFPAHLCILWWNRIASSTSSPSVPRTASPKKLVDPSTILTSRDTTVVDIAFEHPPRSTDGGFHKWVYPKMDGLLWKILFKIGWFRGTPILGNLHIYISNLDDSGSRDPLGSQLALVITVLHPAISDIHQAWALSMWWGESRNLSIHASSCICLCMLYFYSSMAYTPRLNTQHAHTYIWIRYKHIIYQSHIYIWYIYIYNKYYVINIERNRWVITVLYCTSLLYSSVTYLFRSNKEPPWTLVFQSKPSLPYGSSAMPCSCLRMWLVCVAGGYGFSGTGPLELPWGKQMGHAAHLSWV